MSKTRASIVLFGFLLFITFSFGQNKKIDSLKIELQNHKVNDTIKVTLLNSLAHEYDNYDITKAKIKALEANSLAKKLDFKKGEARSFFVLSNIHISKSEFSDAQNYGLQALKLYKNINDYEGVINVYNTLGNVVFHENKPDEALEYFKNGLNIAVEKGDLRLQGKMLKSIGNASFSKGDLNEAITFYKQSITLYEKLGDKKEVLRPLNNMAIIYNLQGKSTKALEYFNKCLATHREDNNKKEIATTTLNISGVYWELYQHDKALNYLQKSLRLHRELKDKRGIAKCLVNMGGVYIDSKEYSRALNSLNEALTINEAINNMQGRFFCHNQIGDLRLLMQQPLIALDNFKSCLSISQALENKILICYSNISLSEAYLTLKKYDKALYYGKEGKQLADDLKLLSQQKEVTGILSKIYEVKGEFKKSLEQFKQYKIVNDSLFNKKNIEKITQLEYEYKYQKQLDSASIRELKLTEQVTATSRDLEKSKQKYLWAIIGFLTVSIILGSTIFFQKFRTVKAKNQTIVTEQKLLRSQMTPHFIFNSLSVLQGMILNKEDKKSVNYLLKFSKLIRITLENSRDKLVLLSLELLAIENYLALQNLENASYQYTITVDKNINTDLLEIPPMLIQPFVENAIEHAFNETIVPKLIDITLNYSQDDLICTIADNGMGINEQKTSKEAHKTSMSTTITSERLQILSKDLKVNGSVTIEDRAEYNSQGTLVTLVIPHKIIQS